MAEGKFLDLPLEEVIGDRFGRYSKYIIQDRALPDVRDGLKPVQRRILYAMHREGNTNERNFRKAAKTVGVVIGNYHPHGDSSVYEAMVRMSQSWKMNIPLIEMHGNNGSIDGDSAAAMRYTEARLAKISSELLKDIEKETVEHVDNFDDTDEEPTVLPAKFPNLLISGSTGISAGYATDIPPHNLNEVIDACIVRLDKPKCTIDDLLEVIKGPDFPTGGIIQGADGIKKAYETGKGRIIVRGRAEVTSLRGGREQIVFDEIPYDVNKANLVKKMDELRLDRKVEGILEVRDETDRTGLRVVIELRKDADSRGILNYLYKNTDLQVTYHFNMVAIEDRTPKLLGLAEILDAYINHQKETVTRAIAYDLRKAKERAHIITGLIKAISVLDELLITIRASNNKKDAKERIMEQYDFTEIQAEAIVTLQLYRLTNTDISSLEQEEEELSKEIIAHEKILNSDRRLRTKIKKDLLEIKKTYSVERRSVIESKISELEININVTVANEDVVLSVTKEGYIKRTSLRSYSASNGEDLALKDGDYPVATLEINTTDEILLFTNKGTYMNIPVHELPDIRWKEPGQHLSNLCGIDSDEEIVECIPVKKDQREGFILFFTKQGMVKRSEFELYNNQRHNRSFIALNLRKEDEVVAVKHTDGEKRVILVSNVGMSLVYEEEKINTVGLRAAGVIAMQLKDNEYIVNADVFAEGRTKQSVYIVTQRGAHKRCRLSDFKIQERTNRGLTILRELKSNPHKVLSMYLVGENDIISLRTETDKTIEIKPYDLNISERTSNGSFVLDNHNEDTIIETYKEVNYEQAFTDN